MDIRKIAMIGAGTMGNGIAQVAAAAGYDVVLMDVGDAVLERAKANIQKSLGRMVKAQKITEEQARETLGRIRTTTSLEDACKEADYVIEAVPERLDLKMETFRKIDASAPAHAILATNTSELSVTAIAAVTRRPQMVIGMHWFNPAPIMKLVEIVRAVTTSDETVKVTEDMSHKMGKTTVVCRDSQGFITTRALSAHLTECVKILEEGVASARDIDTAIKLGLNYPMGPFELADYIGLDVIFHAGHGLSEAYGDRYKLPQTFVKLVQAGHLGRKTGRGFYDYSEKK